MRTLVRGAICATAALFIATGIGTTTATATAAEPYAAATCDGCKYNYISGNGVRIRQTPGGKILALSWYNQRVRLLGTQTGPWVRISTAGPKGRTIVGWVYSNYVGTQY